MPQAIDLTDKQRSVLLETLCQHSPPIERVDVYGSRANGTARPGSDIDLIVAGPIDWSMVARIKGALEESYLSIFADVAAYDLLEPGRFRDQVLATAIPLFTGDDLRTARESTSRVD